MHNLSCHYSKDGTARVYAKRRAGAITGVSSKLWSEHPQGPDPEPKLSKGNGGDRNWSQKGEQNKKPSGFLRVIK